MPTTDGPQRNQSEEARSRTRGGRAVGTNLLASLGETTASTEYYSPLPEGYRKGRHKYVVVLGTVMSGLGKGIFASSVAKMLKDKGLCVAPIKMEGYLNIDSGTLNPYRHGEVFVLDDGTECDMDLGTYERMLDQDLTTHNFTTSGRIYSEILDRERHGVYLGRDVQMIPHVTGEVKRRLRELALRGDGQRAADVVFVEVGGTVGDYENGLYIEAMRELAFEEGPESVCFVALTYVIEPPALGEQKSKAAQLGIKRLLEAGIQPHIIACRATHQVQRQVMEKIAMFSNVPLRRVFSMHDRSSIYTIPDEMRLEGLDREILSLLGLHDRVDVAAEDRGRARWGVFVQRLTRKDKLPLSVGIAGKYSELRDAYASIDKALEHCGAHLGVDIHQHWIEASDIDDSTAATVFGSVDAVIVPGGFGSRGVEGKIAAVKHCREGGVPYLGICLGFQVAVIEFTRNVLRMADANSAEFAPECQRPVISELPEQKKIEGLGGTMRLGAQDVLVQRDSLAARLYRDQLTARSTIHERFRHRYEVDPTYIERLEAHGLIFSGRHPQHPIMQMLELPRQAPADQPVDPSKPRVVHPYFVGAQFHPELTSRPLRPQPLFMGLVAAGMRRRYQQDAEVWRRLEADQMVRHWVSELRGESRPA
ncbi:MAG: CTP synthase (glutamine hydrolyzing) [Phycisphaerales bacterium]|nr:CTP synthase (glutamine hydrolyzing) [Phycisphaerales bacterium]